MEPLIAPGSLREEVPATQRRSRPRGLPDGQPDQHRSTPGSRHAYNKYAHSSRNHRPCRSCGQIHSHHEPHLYNYTDEVDEDLMCQICLQPFVQPVDTPCAHTFCHVCISNYLKINPLCPLDRKPLSEMTINPTNLVLKRLLDKLEVNCPNEDSCEEVVSRGSLSDHLRYRCLGTLVACQFASAGCEYRGPTKSMNKHQNECQFKKEGKPIFDSQLPHVSPLRLNVARNCN
ncbi:hypothetical protein TCAL_10702 [Tigriopus californicus]|uniref:RING-type domain-containing protein n=1 Tax=Tigriopus californicus TaxID=6832 RepID=A0A553NXR6_TIGCA|nr:hypothetical protein TCAL_10702 [Tigriopus californicus]